MITLPNGEKVEKGSFVHVRLFDSNTYLKVKLVKWDGKKSYYVIIGDSSSEHFYYGLNEKDILKI